MSVELYLTIREESASEALDTLRRLAVAVSGLEATPKVAEKGATPALEDNAPPKRRKKAATASEDAPKGETPATPETPPRGPVEAPDSPSEAPVGGGNPTTTPEATVTPPSVPQTAPNPAPTSAASVPTATAPATAPINPSVATPAPPQATPNGRPVTLDDLATMGSALVDQGKMPEVMRLLSNRGLQAITQLKEADYPDFARELLVLGGVLPQGVTL